MTKLSAFSERARRSKAKNIGSQREEAVARTGPFETKGSRRIRGEEADRDLAGAVRRRCGPRAGGGRGPVRLHERYRDADPSGRAEGAIHGTVGPGREVGRGGGAGPTAGPH